MQRKSEKNRKNGLILGCLEQKKAGTHLPLVQRGMQTVRNDFGFFPSAIVHFCVRKQAALAAVRKIAVFLSPNPPEEPFLFVASACTVDLDMPNCVAAERTVARFSMMYTARSQARSSIFVYKYTTPHSLVFNVYEWEAGDMFRPGGAGKDEANMNSVIFMVNFLLRICL